MGRSIVRLGNLTRDKKQNRTNILPCIRWTIVGFITLQIALMVFFVARSGGNEVLIDGLLAAPHSRPRQRLSTRNQGLNGVRSPPVVVVTNKLDGQDQAGVLVSGETRNGLTNARSPNQGGIDQFHATIIVQLKGEMCNNLQKFAFGYGLHLWAKQRHGLATNIVLRHLPRKGKWIPARDDVHQCFPNLRSYDFDQGNHPEFKQRRKQQTEWLKAYQPESANLLNTLRAVTGEDRLPVDMTETLQHLIQGENPAQIEAGLAILDDLVHRKDKPHVMNVGKHAANITIPNVWIGNRPMHNVFLDKYFQDYRRLFAFDSQACCSRMPHRDESVFHFRQFSTELQKLSFEEQAHRGYTELNPHQAAHQLFGHLKAGDKLAMTTRFHTDLSQSYVAAFQERGIQVRVIANQTGVQDFCFLKHARKELVGVAKSTFVRWAGFLGDSPKVRLYSVRVAGVDSNSTVTSSLKEYPWQTRELKERFTFEEYEYEQPA